jgi:hypothetical protein
MWIKICFKKEKNELRKSQRKSKYKNGFGIVRDLFPVKENPKTAFYFAFDREEKIPSLSVDFVKNKAFDFGTEKVMM